MERPETIEFNDLFDKDHNIKDEITVIQFTNNLITVRFNRVINPDYGTVSREWYRDSLKHDTCTHRTNNSVQPESKIVSMMSMIRQAKQNARTVQKLKGFVIIW